MNSILERMRDNPIVAAIRRNEDVEAAIASQVTTVFILNADIFNLKSLVDRIRSGGKNVLVHIDFVEGLGKDQKAIDYVARLIKPDGIISTKSQHIKYAKEIGLFTIQRFFLVDSLSYHTMTRAIQAFKPDMIEIMPGMMPEVIKKVSRQVEVPVIAGGLIETKQDIIEILKAGAVGASTGKRELWAM